MRTLKRGGDALADASRRTRRGPAHEDAPADPVDVAEHGARPDDRRWLPLVIAVALVAIGAGAFLLGSSLDAGGTRVVGSNVAITAAASDPRDIDAHNSPTVVRNPTDDTNLVVVNRIDTPSFSCAMHVSFDAGASWTAIRIPFPEGEELPERCYAPDASFGPDGRLYVSFVTLAGLGNTPNAAWVVSSDDGGRSLSLPVRAAGELAFQVRVAADPDQPGVVHLTWLQAESVAVLGFSTSGNRIVMSSSRDGARSWSQPNPVSDPSRDRVLAPVSAVADGTLYVLHLDLEEDRLDYHGAHEGLGGSPYPGAWSLLLVRSTDNGATWSETVIADDVIPAQRLIAFIPPSPALAVEPARGTVYAAMADARLGDPDVWLWASIDGGATFRSPVRVNDTPSRDATAQYLPALGIAPDGRVDVLYYDRRDDDWNRMNEVSLQSSSDGGSSFDARLSLSDVPIDSRIGFGSERGMPDLGSRLGMVSSDRGTLAVWTDTRMGTEASNKQVLAQAITAHPERSLSTALQLAGAGAALAGLLLAWWLVASRRSVSRARAHRGS